MKTLIFIVMLFLCNPSVVNAMETVRISSGEWPPYISEKLTHYGAASHIVTRAFAEVGIEVEYIFLPWKRAYRYAKDGMGEGQVVHGSVVWVYTAERAKFFNYSDTVIDDQEVLFHLKDKPLKWKTVEDLLGKKIGGTAHTAYPLFEDAEKRGLLSIERAGNYDALFQRLLAERIDAVPQVRHVGEYFLRNALATTDREKITCSATVVDHRKYHLIFSRIGDRNQYYLNLFNKGLRILKKNGEYQNILNNLNDGKYYSSN